MAASSLEAAAQTPTAPGLTDNSGLDFFRPPPNLFQVTTDYKTSPGATREVTTESLNLRYDHAVDLGAGLIFGTRADLPLLAKNPINDSNPNGDYISGVGDVDVQATLVKNLNQRLAFGFGMRLVVPNGDDALGSGKWRILPIVGARFGLPEINSASYFEPVFRYDVSVAGDPTKRNVSNLQFAPTFNIGLPDRWFVTLFPSTDIRINYGDPITDRPVAGSFQSTFVSARRLPTTLLCRWKLACLSSRTIRSMTSRRSSDLT